MMKRFFINLAIIVGLSCLLGQASIAQDTPQKPIILMKGTFLKAFLQKEISTQLADIGDKVYLINSLDMYVDDTNVIPSGSKLYGFIEDLREPVQGTNASVKIKIEKIITPSGVNIPVNAYVYGEDDNYLGGERTHAMYYNRMPHYIEGMGGGVLQFAPTDIRYPGQHLLIKAGSEQKVVLIDDLKIN